MSTLDGAQTDEGKNEHGLSEVGPVIQEVANDGDKDMKNPSSSEEDELNIGFTGSLDQKGPLPPHEGSLEGDSADVVSSDTMEESEEVESQSEGVSLEKAVEEKASNGQEINQQVEVVSKAPRKRQQTMKTSLTKARKKRTQVMERIPRSKRCGTCPTCLNPHWKKACLTARKEWDKKDIHAHLRKLVDSAGGISDASKIKELVGIMNSESSVEARTSLLNIVKLSSRAAQTYFVKKLGVETLEIWLMEEGKLLEEGKGKDHAPVLVKILETLEILPISISVLNSTQIGRTVRKLKKAPAPRVSAMAGKVFDKWKSMVAADAPAPETSKAAPASKGQTLPTATHLEKGTTTSVGTGNVQKNVSSVKESIKPSKPESKPTILSAADDLLGKKRPAPTLAARTDKPKKIQVQDVLSSISTSPDTPSQAPSYDAKPANETKEPLDDQKEDEGNDHPRIMTFGGKPIYLYGQTSGDHPFFKSAADLAKEAASNVPSPPPSPRRSKPKTKSVKFKEDSHLAEIRWFLKSDEPVVISKGKASFEPLHPSSGEDSGGAHRVHEMMRREAELERQQIAALRAEAVREGGAHTKTKQGGVLAGQRDSQPSHLPVSPEKGVLSTEEAHQKKLSEAQMKQSSDFARGPHQSASMPGQMGEGVQRMGYGSMHPGRMGMPANAHQGMVQNMHQGMYPGRPVNQMPGQMPYPGHQMSGMGQVTGYKYGSLAQGGMRQMPHGGMRPGQMMGGGQGMIPGVGQTNVPGMHPAWAHGTAQVPQSGMGQGLQPGMGQGQRVMPGMWQQQQQQQQMYGLSQGANPSQSSGNIDRNLLNQVLGNTDLMNLLGAVSNTNQSSQQGAGGTGNGNTSQAHGPVDGAGEEELSEENKTPCAFFNTPKGCRKGNKCKFLHQTS